MSTSTTLDKESVGRAIGRIGSGVHVIAMDRNGERDGLLTSWIAQAAFEPPAISLAVKKGRQILSKLPEGATFTVSVLSKNNMDIYKNFAKPYTPDLNRFEGLNVEVDKNGNPYFKDAVAYMSCVVTGRVEAGDHFVLVAQIVAGNTMENDNEPMIHLRKNGFQY
ncbi:MAG TPA: flavin reductase family protein [Oculatellaceae cyanobacterium]